MSAPKLPRKQIFDVTGENWKNDDGSYRQKILQNCLPGEAVTLERQPDNPHDPNAIFVHLTENGQGVGYISRKENAELALALDSGVAAKARLHELKGGLPDYPNFGCRICIVSVEKPFPECLPLRPEQTYYAYAPTWRQAAKSQKRRTRNSSGGLISKIFKGIFK